MCSLCRLLELEKKKKKVKVPLLFHESHFFLTDLMYVCQKPVLASGKTNLNCTAFSFTLCFGFSTGNCTSVKLNSLGIHLVHVLVTLAQVSIVFHVCFFS